MEAGEVPEKQRTITRRGRGKKHKKTGEGPFTRAQVAKEEKNVRLVQKLFKKLLKNLDLNEKAYNAYNANLRLC